MFPLSSLKSRWILPSVLVAEDRELKPRHGFPKFTLFFFHRALPPVSLYLFSLPFFYSLSRAKISLLKQSLELQLSQSQAALQQLQSQFNQERELLSQQLKGQFFSVSLGTDQNKAALAAFSYFEKAVGGSSSK